MGGGGAERGRALRFSFCHYITAHYGGGILLVLLFPVLGFLTLHSSIFLFLSYTPLFFTLSLSSSLFLLLPLPPLSFSFLPLPSPTLYRNLSKRNKSMGADTVSSRSSTSSPLFCLSQTSHTLSIPFPSSSPFHPSPLLSFRPR